MPIAVKKHKNNEINAKGEELWNNEEIMKSFLRLLHGSFDNKRIIVSDFILRYFLLKMRYFKLFPYSYPNLSKASIERKIKETSKKDKLEGESKARYFVNRELFENLVIIIFDLILNYHSRRRLIRSMI